MREWTEKNGRWYQSRDGGVTVVVEYTGEGAVYSFYYDGPKPVIRGVTKSIEDAKWQADTLEWSP